MDFILDPKIQQFAQLAKTAGWEWCGVQESIPPLLPCWIIQKGKTIRSQVFDPENFDPIKTATLHFALEEHK